MAEALKLQKMTVTFRHMFFTGQIFDTAFRGEIYFVFAKRAVAEALKLQKMTVTFRHMFFTGQIFDTAFRGEIYFVFELHENMEILTGLKLIAMATVIAWISQSCFIVAVKAKTDDKM